LAARKADGSLPQFVPNWVFRLFPLATFALRPLLPPYGRHRKTPGMREAKRLQTKGKKLKRMAITLKDRKETVNLGGNVYELTLLWNREDIRRCAFGMTPDYAHIRKDGKNFAFITCYSNGVGFSVENFHWVLVNPEWKIYFRNEDINTIPLEKLLKRLPIW